MDGFFGKFVVIGIVLVLIYYILGGLRYVVMDLGYWEELELGNISVKVVIVFWVVLIVVLGVVLW